MLGLDLIIEPSGTVIRDDNGKEATVTDDTVVFRKHQMFLTQKMYDALKSHPDVKTECP